MMKRKGDMGSPWRRPQDGMKVDEGETLTNMEKNKVDIRDLI